MASTQARPVTSRRTRPMTASGPILVTGASSGIGAATATMLAARGHRVLAGVRHLGDAADIAAANPLIEPIELDLTNPTAIAAFAARVEEEPSGLGGLVNNAGTISVGAIELIETERWEEIMRVNVIGTIAVTKAALPGLLRARGRVVNISSPTGRIALPMFGPYAVSKFALEAFNDTLRREVGPSGVKVILVSPGSIKTPIFDKGIAEGEAMFNEHFDNPELHRRYASMAASAIKAGEDGQTSGADPSVAAGVIAQALTSRRPKTRYSMGVENKAVGFITRALPDRVLDALIGKMVAMNDDIADRSKGRN